MIQTHTLYGSVCMCFEICYHKLAARSPKNERTNERWNERKEEGMCKMAKTKCAQYKHRFSEYGGCQQRVEVRLFMARQI